MEDTFHAIIEEWIHIVCQGLSDSVIDQTFSTMAIAAANAAAYDMGNPK